MIPCRSIDSIGRTGRQITTYKTNLVKRGYYAQFSLCAHHIAFAREHLGKTSRLSNGRHKFLADPDAAYDARACSNKFFRLVIFERANGKCCRCGTALSFNAPSNNWQVDHVVPIFRGGQTKLSNLQLLCRVCHDAKTAPEKSEVALLRWHHGVKRGTRFMTHYEKDLLIDRLRSRLRELGAPTD
jgi:hypothetical protein